MDRVVVGIVQKLSGVWIGEEGRILGGRHREGDHHDGGGGFHGECTEYGVDWKYGG